MPATPHPVTFTVNNDAGSALTGATVYVRNCTKKTTRAVGTTNGSGQAIIDLANLPIGAGQTVEYEAGDVCLLIAYKGNQHDAARYVVTGANKAQTLQMNSVPHYGGLSSVRLLSILGGNTTGTGYYAQAYAIDDGELLAHLEVPANDSRGHFFGSHGKGASGGFVIARENVGLIVTVSVQ